MVQIADLLFLKFYDTKEKSSSTPTETFENHVSDVLESLQWNNTQCPKYYFVVQLGGRLRKFSSACYV